MADRPLTDDEVERAVAAARLCKATGMNRVVTRQYLPGLYVEDIILGLAARLAASPAPDPADG